MDTNHLLINLEGISFSYGGGPAILHDVRLRLYERQRIGLIGPNGSGKTTLFHVIMGLLKPTAGKIELLGKRMLRERDFRHIRQQIGLLFQDPDDQLFSPTVLEDIAFGPLNQGKSAADAKETACSTLRSLGLAGLENRLTYKLSGGEKRLVSLAAVLAMQPQVLLLDEPTTGLDPDTTERLIEILQNLDLAYIFISHNMDFIMHTTNQSLCMVGGTITAEEEFVQHTHTHAHGFGQLPHIHSEVSQDRPAGRKEK